MAYGRRMKRRRRMCAGTSNRLFVIGDINIAPAIRGDADRKAEHGTERLDCLEAAGRTNLLDRAVETIAT